MLDASRALGAIDQRWSSASKRRSLSGAGGGTRAAAAGSSRRQWESAMPSRAGSGAAGRVCATWRGAPPSSCGAPGRPIDERRSDALRRRRRRRQRTARGERGGQGVALARHVARLRACGGAGMVQEWCAARRERMWARGPERAAPLCTRARGPRINMCLPASQQPWGAVPGRSAAWHQAIAAPHAAPRTPGTPPGPTCRCAPPQTMTRASSFITRHPRSGSPRGHSASAAARNAAASLARRVDMPRSAPPSRASTQILGHGSERTGPANQRVPRPYIVLSPSSVARRGICGWGTGT